MNPKKQKFIPYSFQAITNRDTQSVLKTLKSSRITQGPRIPEFEQNLAKFCGAKYAVAVSSGTAGLHLAGLAFGVIEGDEVITSPNSFVATSNSVLYCGGKPVFADIESIYLNIDPNEIKKKINSKTKGLIPVHFAGHPYQVEEIHALAQKNGLFIIEDACHALGASYRIKNKWYKVGSCAHADASILSFHPVKSITTGEGGAVLTNRKDIYEKLISLRSHGIVRDATSFKNRDLAFPEGLQAPWYYEMQDLGFNYRITDIQCALGISQLRSLSSLVDKRRNVAKIYNQAFKDFEGIIIPKEHESARSAYHLYPIQLTLKKLRVERTKIFQLFQESGIGAQVHYIPIHFQPYYMNFGFKKGDFPVTEKYYASTISIPLFPSITAKQVQYVIRTIQTIITNNLK